MRREGQGREQGDATRRSGSGVGSQSPGCDTRTLNRPETGPMNSPSLYRYKFVQHPWEDCPADTELLSEVDFQEIEGRTESIPDLPAPTWAQDLLRIARAVYLTDKRSPRKDALDQWTRTIELSIPVLDPRAWNSTALSSFHELLETLTADEWQLTLRPGAEPYHAQGNLFEWRADEVALFSGGLDSTVHAAMA